MAWQTALLAIIFSFVNPLFRKKGAMRGPVAPMKTVHVPLRIPTLKK